jgi:hypothetical protein
MTPNRILKRGLLSALLCAGQVFLFADPGELKVLCEMDREDLQVGRAFSLTLLVNHGELHEVVVTPPDLQGKFRLERQRSFVRVIRETMLETEQWSVFEFVFVPLEEGSQTVAAFTVYARDQSVPTEDLPLSIAPARSATPSFHWEAPFPALKVGEWSVFRLTMVSPGASSQNILQQLQRLRFEPPPEAVVTSAVLDPPKNRNVVELRVLPLRPGTFLMKAIEFDYAGDHTVTTLRIPELRTVIR